MPLPIPEKSPLSGAAKKQTIAILGGGAAAMAAAFELTDHDDWRDHYDITVYQLGWRLGGKGASGRNQKRANRIEEHGLHIWSGSYENAFTLLQKCYQCNQELPPVPGLKKRAWENAFSPQNELYLIEELEAENRWQPWVFRLPKFPGEPGNKSNPDDYTRVGSFVELLLMLLDYIQESAQDHFEPETDDASDDSLFERIEEWAEDLWEALTDSVATALRGLRHFIKGFIEDTLEDLSDLLVRLLEALRSGLRKLFKDGKLSRHIWVLMDYGITLAHGLLEDKLLTQSFDTISDTKFDDWLIKHHIGTEALESPFLSATYDLVFAFPNGRISRKERDVDAATMLKVSLRVALRCRGAALWRMNSGMGDIVFEPLYTVLKNRGVEFKFFHEVTKLRLSPDKKAVQQIEINRQATPKDEFYDPLIRVNGFLCWPSEPRYNKLVEGKTLRKKQIDLEIPNHPRWKPKEKLTLQAGEDFDIVILGIPIGALPDICEELIAACSAWENMIKHVRTLPTQSAQLWLRPNLRAIGWEDLLKQPSAGDQPPTSLPMVGSIPATQLDTWVAMDQLLPEESWPPEAVNTIAYFTGILEPDTAADPEAGLDIVKKNMLQLLGNIKKMWLFANQVEDSSVLDWNLLAAQDNLKGIDRFYDQFFKANVTPSERYVLSLTGSKKYRLKGDKSGFERLYLVGDWTENGLNLGMVEAAVMSGLLVSRALIGSPDHIAGEDDFF